MPLIIAYKMKKSFYRHNDTHASVFTHNPPTRECLFVCLFFFNLSVIVDNYAWRTTYIQLYLQVLSPVRQKANMDAGSLIQHIERDEETTSWPLSMTTEWLEDGNETTWNQFQQPDWQVREKHWDNKWKWLKSELQNLKRWHFDDDINERSKKDDSVK